jgi:hypothetical protein
MSDLVKSIQNIKEFDGTLLKFNAQIINTQKSLQHFIEVGDSINFTKAKAALAEQIKQHDALPEKPVQPACKISKAACKLLRAQLKSKQTQLTIYKMQSLILF